MSKVRSSYGRNIYRKVQNRAQSINTQRLLTAENLAWLNDAFRAHNWRVDMANTASCFNRFRRTLSTLTSEEQSLLLSLTMRFEHLPMTTYLDLMIPILQNLRNDYPDDYIYFVRCIKEEDVGKIKSCETVLYQLKGTSVLQKIDLGEYSVVDDFKDIDVNMVKKREAIIVLVDDYMGTGDTAKGAIEYLIKCVPQLSTCDKDRFCLLTLAAYEGGKHSFESLGYKVYVAVVQNKGITDYYKDEECSHNVQIMTGIEHKLTGLSKRFRFGYGQTEGLICMERCPNNTFPIYWFKEGDAPYERKRS